jgi:hypothetical protein
MKILYITSNEESKHEVKKNFGKEDQVMCAGALEGIALTGLRDFDYVLLDSKLRNYDSCVISEHINKKIPRGYYIKGGIFDSLDQVTGSTCSREVITESVHNWPVTA